MAVPAMNQIKFDHFVNFVRTNSL